MPQAMQSVYIAARQGGWGPVKICRAKFHGEKEPQRSERAGDFLQKSRRKRYKAYILPPARAAGAPVKICGAKFHGEKEE